MWLSCGALLAVCRCSSSLGTQLGDEVTGQHHKTVVRHEMAASRGVAGGACCPAQVWHMDRPGDMLVLPLEAELPPNAIVRVNQPGSLVRA